MRRFAFTLDALLDLSEHLAKKDRIRTYKEIADFVMSKIAELGEQDRKRMKDEG